MPLPLSANSITSVNIGHIYRNSDIIGRLSILTGNAVYPVSHDNTLFPVFFSFSAAMKFPGILEQSEKMYEISVIVAKKVDKEAGSRTPWRKMRSRLCTTNWPR
jgi:hypothetical protein